MTILYFRSYEFSDRNDYGDSETRQISGRELFASAQAQDEENVKIHETEKGRKRTLRKVEEARRVEKQETEIKCERFSFELP